MLNDKGAGQIIFIGVIICLIIITGYFLKINKLDNTLTSNLSDQSAPSASATPTPHPEAKSLEIPKNHSQIKWDTVPVATESPVYLHFNGKEYGGEVPLTGKRLVGLIADNPENNTLIEDYYRSNLEKQGWVRKILQIPGYKLGILAGRPLPFCLFRETYVYLGYKDDMVQLIKITSGIDPDPGCSETAPLPSGFSKNKNIKYDIFISDPLPIDTIRQKEFEIS